MLQDYIRNVPDFPKPGINYKDITPLLADKQALNRAMLKIASHYSDIDLDLVVGIESRGFIFGTGISLLLGKGFAPIRKPGKLPHQTYKETYELEYGTDTLEIHKDAIKPGQKILLIDDLLATGGTMAASIKLAEKCGAQVIGCAFVIELEFLKGRDQLGQLPVFSLMQYGPEN